MYWKQKDSRREFITLEPTGSCCKCNIASGIRAGHRLGFLTPDHELFFFISSRAKTHRGSSNPVPPFTGDSTFSPLSSGLASLVSFSFQPSADSMSLSTRRSHQPRCHPPSDCGHFSKPPRKRNLVWKKEENPSRHHSSSPVLSITSERFSDRRKSLNIHCSRRPPESISTEAFRSCFPVASIGY